MTADIVYAHHISLLVSFCDHCFVFGSSLPSVYRYKKIYIKFWKQDHHLVWTHSLIFIYEFKIEWSSPLRSLVVPWDCQKTIVSHWPLHPTQPNELQTGGQRAESGCVCENVAAIFVCLNAYVNIQDVVKAARVRPWKHMTSSSEH